MKKNVKCIAQTINQSHQRTCVRPRQVKKLINADVLGPCPESVRNPYKASCRPVPIRICTRRDMERTLPPKVCECPQKTAPETVGKKLRRWVKNLVKTGVASGLVYWTSAEGFWGDGRDSESLYHRIIRTVAPAFEEVADLEEMKLPHIDNIRHEILDAYNRSVLRVVGLVVGVPIILEEKIYEVLYPCYETDDGEAGIRKDEKKALNNFTRV